ncbi:MAG: molybdopterin-binding protein [Enterovirga sp.]|nr:molybdopterin-binding protein [Enterovirga sp.]
MIGRSASSAQLSLAAALDQLLRGRNPVRPCRLPIPSALGFNAAETICAGVDLPGRVVASRDGWAVSFVAVAGASHASPVVLGSAPTWVEAGEALPGPTDTVLPPDAIETGTSRHVIADAAPGDGTLEAGAELRAGDVIVGTGERIGPQHLLALACTGLQEVPVRVPRVALLATGGERRRNALGPALAALVSGSGAVAFAAGPAPDSPDGTAEAIRTAAETADVVLVLGGTGLGRGDGSAAALALAGTLSAHGLALRPGETAGFGHVDERAVLLLPGRPDAALATFLALGRPLLHRLSGLRESDAGPTLRLGRKISSSIGVTELVFVRRVGAGMEPLGAEGIPLRLLLQAEGTVLVPPEREGYPEGTTIEMMPLWTSR